MPTSSLTRRPTNQAPNTRFIGRQIDLKSLHQKFEEGERLITVWGTAGMGKTRLALEYAFRYRNAGGNALFCDLSEAQTTDCFVTVVSSIAGVSLDNQDQADAITLLGNALAVRGRLLIILDNFEQLVDAAAPLVSEWMKAAPKTRFLVTSRERLRIQGEFNYELQPLSLPSGDDPMDSEAVQLFVDRAKRYTRGFELNEGNAALIAELVERLEGIPLAIELAAARIDLLGIKGLLSKLAERLDSLGGGGRDVQPRQATLRGAIAWSWDLLNDRERQALSQCSVFQGGFTLAAAEAVLMLGDNKQSILDIVQSLRDKSLLLSRNHDGEVRFGQFQSVQAFATETLAELGQADATRERHSQYFLDYGSRLAAQFETNGQLASLHLIEAEMDNLLAVHERGLATPQSINDALGALLAIHPVLTMHRPLPSHIALLNQTLAAGANGSADPELLLRARRARGNAFRIHGQLEKAEVDLNAALKSKNSATRSAALADLGVVKQQQRDMGTAMKLYQEALATLETNGALREQGRVLGNLGALYHDEGLFDEALGHYRKALGIFAEVGDQRLEGIFLANLGILELETDKFSDARTHFKRALMSLEEVKDSRLVAITLGNLGTLAHLEGDLSHAERCHNQALILLREVSDRRSEAFCLGRVGALRAAMGHCGDARICIDEAEMLLERLDDPIGMAAVTLQRGFIELAQAAQAQIRGDTAQLREYLDEADSRIEAAQGGKTPIVEQSDDARSTIRLMSAWRDQLDPDRCMAQDLREHALLLGSDAQWFRPPGGEYVDLRRRKSARRIMRALADHHSQDPGIAMSTDALVEAGWPGESMVADAGINRVHVALNQLRKMGLKECLSRNADGYLLEPALDVQHVNGDWRTLAEQH
jgi:predicted ATPase/Tfp pilus assembly protein PilF